MSSGKNKLVADCISFIRREGRFPSKSDLVKIGISRDKVRHHFGNNTKLKDFILSIYSDDIKDVMFHPKATYVERVTNAIKTKKVFVVVSAVPNQPLDQKFKSSLDSYCKHRNAALLVVPTSSNYLSLDINLKDELLILESVKLNDNLHISNFPIDPKQVDPIVGLDRFGIREGSFIFGSPKQRLKPIATSNTNLPHILATPGAITKAIYGTSDKKTRRDLIAEKDHVVGAYVVEIENNNYYYIRNILSDTDGSFIDLGTKFSSDGRIRAAKTEAVVYGDYHVGETDILADKAGAEICKLLKPKYLVLHDFFSGISINHHDKEKKVTRAVLADSSKLSLSEEIKLNSESISKLRKLAKTLLIVESNHNEFLRRYLEAGDFEDHNRILAMKLCIEQALGRNPLKSAVHDDAWGRSVLWLDRDEDFRITKSKVQIACHGDIGSNGRRNPGAAGMEKAYGDCVFGHCHAPEILRNSMSVGTKSKLKLTYNKGASSWLHADAAVYENGKKQLLIIIEGKWRSK